MSLHKRVLVTGAGGFIGHRLVSYLKEKGEWVRGVDIKEPDYEPTEADEFELLDLRRWPNCLQATRGMNEVYNLAANMGGIGFIENNKALCMLSVLINTNLLMAARVHGVDRFFFSSSACVYAADKQVDPDVTALKEQDAYPAMPEDGYGWEKLFSERMCRHFQEDFGIETVVARYHNVYGEHGTYRGGREKAPAAICRKVIEAKLSGRHEIEIWGDGQQTRSFMYISDCVQGTQRIMESRVPEPVNLGSSRLVTIDRLVDIVEDIAGVHLQRNYNRRAPLGVRGRNSDNTLIRSYLGWEPSVPLEDGIERTYRWISDQMAGVEGAAVRSGSDTGRMLPGSVAAGT